MVSAFVFSFGAQRPLKSPPNQRVFERTRLWTHSSLSDRTLNISKHSSIMSEQVQTPVIDEDLDLRSASSGIKRQASEALQDAELDEPIAKVRKESEPSSPEKPTDITLRVKLLDLAFKANTPKVVDLRSFSKEVMRNNFDIHQFQPYSAEAILQMTDVFVLAAATSLPYSAQLERDYPGRDVFLALSKHCKKLKDGNVVPTLLFIGPDLNDAECRKFRAEKLKAREAKAEEEAALIARSKLVAQFIEI